MKRTESIWVVGSRKKTSKSLQFRPDGVEWFRSAAACKRHCKLVSREVPDLKLKPMKFLAARLIENKRTNSGSKRR